MASAALFWTLKVSKSTCLVLHARKLRPQGEWCGHGEGGKEWPYQQLDMNGWLFTCSVKGSSTKTEKEAPFPDQHSLVSGGHGQNVEQIHSQDRRHLLTGIWAIGLPMGLAKLP